MYKESASWKRESLYAKPTHKLQTGIRSENKMYVHIFFCNRKSTGSCIDKIAILLFLGKGKYIILEYMFQAKRNFSKHAKCFVQ